MLVMAMGLGLVPNSLLSTTAWAAVDADGFTSISTAQELDTAVRNGLSGKYRLQADIDLSTYAYNQSTWTAAKGWAPMGTSLANGFKGVLDGNGHTISGLWSKDRGSNQGLFGWLSGATIKNLTIELSPAGITGAGERKAGLAADAYKGTLIENCHVVGSTNGSPITGSANYIAGLVGVVNSSQVLASSAVNVNCSGYSYIAGLIGVTYRDGSSHDQSIVKDSYATGTVKSSGPYAGGFIGAPYGQSIISGSWADVTVTANGSYAGGFAGVIYEGSTVRRCYALGDVETKICYAGGFAGDLYDKSLLEESCAYGNVTSKGYIAGGLVGEAIYSTIRNCYAQGNVRGTTGTGGLVGYFSGTGGAAGKSVYNSYSSGTVTGVGSTEYGAFNGASGVTYLGTNYYDTSKNPGLRGYGSYGNPKNGGENSFPQSKTTPIMMKQATFIGWDFDTIWGIDENETYPYFIWMPGQKPSETKTVTGLVYPMVTDDLGLGEEFLHKHDISVELRATFQTPAANELATVAVWTGKGDLGRFTFEQVPSGDYLLYIKRPGYLTRCLEVTITSADPEVVELSPPGSETEFNLWWGDVNDDLMVDNLDLMAILESMSLNIHALHPDYNPAHDLNADGLIDNLELMMVMENLNKNILQYPGAENVDPWS